MNKQIELNPTSIIIMVAIFIVIFIITLIVGKMFKRCCLYSYEKGIKLFSIPNMVVFIVPFFLIGVTLFYKIKYITIPIIVLSIIGFIFVPIIINIARMGFIYGASISFFRIIASTFGAMLGCGVIAIFGMAVIIGFCAFESVFEKSITVITTDGEMINVIPTGVDQCMDTDGNIYRMYGNIWEKV